MAPGDAPPEGVESLLDSLRVFTEAHRGSDLEGFWWRFSVYSEGQPVRKVTSFLVLAEGRFVMLVDDFLIRGEIVPATGGASGMELLPDPPVEAGGITIDLPPMSYECAISAGGRVLSLYYRYPQGDGSESLRELYERKDPGVILDYAGNERAAAFLSECLAITAPR